MTNAQSTLITRDANEALDVIKKLDDVRPLLLLSGVRKMTDR